MMHEFLSTNRKELIERCRAKVAQRAAPEATKDELDHGIAHFLDQLIETLKVEQTAEPMQSRRISGPSGGAKPGSSEMGDVAAKHGRELLQHGFTVDQVVHDYGDLCQSITDLAFELKAPFETDEFRTLNRCLDNAIADAVTEFNYQRDFVTADMHADALNERLGSFAHELRNLLNSATLALIAVKEGHVGLNGATGALLDRSLVGMCNLIDRSLSDVRMTAGMPARHQLFSLSDFIADVKLSASLEAGVHECVLTVRPVDSRLAVDADRDLLSSAVGNLLQNAFKFTRHRSEVTLNAYAAAERILIQVEDKCGGIAGDTEKLFSPFTQTKDDMTGLGLGLPISRRSVEVNKGTLSVRNISGQGCVFTIDLPRHEMPQPFSVVADAVA
jgi:signal transduction histidine kinase